MCLPTATVSIEQSNRSPGFLNFQLTKDYQLTLKMASAQVVKTSVTNNSPFCPSGRRNLWGGVGWGGVDDLKVLNEGSIAPFPILPQKVF